MTVDQTITGAMTLSDTIAESVLSSRSNGAAIAAAEQLLIVLRAQAELIGRDNVVPLNG
ncbi:hypothetical protein [Antarcticimicrobium luteum]|uniref:hypothetical protein n=1 Tax=Antarcticimicrobium luteum TaxID=2547397 RepID=UPI00140C6070|nr:hypothetical protein [Antarcticimicrobium luteum]